MARSTPQECARLGSLTEYEDRVLSLLAYGYTRERMQVQLALRSDSNGLTIARTIAIICDKLVISRDVAESERLRRARKIYVDAQEISREREYEAYPEVHGVYAFGN